MTTLGMLYNNKNIKEQLKSYIKTTDIDIDWNDVYTVNIEHTTGKPCIMVIGDKDFKKIAEFEILKVFPKGWEKKFESKNKKSWWRFW